MKRSQKNQIIIALIAFFAFLAGGHLFASLHSSIVGEVPIHSYAGGQAKDGNFGLNLLPTERFWVKEGSAFLQNMFVDEGFYVYGGDPDSSVMGDIVVNAASVIEYFTDVYWDPKTGSNIDADTTATIHGPLTVGIDFEANADILISGGDLYVEKFAGNVVAGLGGGNKWVCVDPTWTTSPPALKEIYLCNPISNYRITPSYSCRNTEKYLPVNLNIYSSIGIAGISTIWHLEGCTADVAEFSAEGTTSAAINIKENGPPGTCLVIAEIGSSGYEYASLPSAVIKIIHAYHEINSDRNGDGRFDSADFNADVDGDGNDDAYVVNWPEDIVPLVNLSCIVGTETLAWGKGGDGDVVGATTGGGAGGFAYLRETMGGYPRVIYFYEDRTEVWREISGAPPLLLIDVGSGGNGNEGGAGGDPDFSGAGVGTSLNVWGGPIVQGYNNITGALPVEVTITSGSIAADPQAWGVPPPPAVADVLFVDDGTYSAGAGGAKEFPGDPSKVIIFW